jgi:hypothetical protein
MILRRYTNAKGEQQEVVMTAEEWEKVTDESLNELLGFNKPAPVEKAAPAAKPAPKKKK